MFMPLQNWPATGAGAGLCATTGAPPGTMAATARATPATSGSCRLRRIKRVLGRRSFMTFPLVSVWQGRGRRVLAVAPSLLLFVRSRPSPGRPRSDTRTRRRSRIDRLPNRHVGRLYAYDFMMSMLGAADRAPHPLACAVADRPGPTGPPAAPNRGGGEGRPPCPSFVGHSCRVRAMRMSGPRWFRSSPAKRAAVGLGPTSWIVEDELDVGVRQHPGGLPGWAVGSSPGPWR